MCATGRPKEAVKSIYSNRGLTLCVLQADLKEAVESIHSNRELTLYVLQTDLKEAVKSIYTIQNSVCAKDRPNRGIYNFVHARDRFIVCKEHIHKN